MSKKSSEVILVIPDLHIPYHHPHSLKFLAHLKKKFKPTKIVNLGDEVDWHSISYHENLAELDSPGAELKKARKYLKQLEELFPKMKICHSNHGSLILRKTKSAGLPLTILKSYNEIYEVGGGWEWLPEVVVDGIMFRHSFSKNTARSVMLLGMNIVQGHFHSEFNTHYVRHGMGHNWGVTSGCLIDRESLAFEYANNNLPLAMLGATIIENGVPRLIPMRLNPKGKWIGRI